VRRWVEGIGCEEVPFTDWNGRGAASAIVEAASVIFAERIQGRR
jgi:hypothetical protein